MIDKNRTSRRDLIRAGGAMAAGMLMLPSAWAQLPASLRLVVGFPAGGTADALARVLAPAMAMAGGDLSVVVENKAGATGQLAADFVRGTTDESALLVTPSSVLSLVPQLYRKPMFDPVADFAPVGCVGEHAMGFAVLASSPHATLSEYLRWAKENAKDATYATPGIGSALHFLGASLSRDSGAALTHVPYRGVMPGLQDLIGGQVSATINPLPTLIEFHKAGRIRLLAVTSPQRVASIAQVPTVAELGWKKLEFVEWYGVFASTAVPPTVLGSLQTRLAQAMAAASLAEAAKRLEVALRPLDGNRLRQLLLTDMASWKSAVQATGIQLES